MPETLHTLLLVLTAGPQLRLTYRSAEACGAAMGKIDAMAGAGPAWAINGEGSDREVVPLPERRFCTLADDFGNRCVVALASLAAYVSCDVAADCRGQKEFSLVQARGQAELQREAQADPKLRFLGAGMPGVRA